MSTTGQTARCNVNIGIDKKQCKTLGKMLTQLYCDEFVIFGLYHNFAFNVVGSRHRMLNVLFCELAKCSCKNLKRIAYQIRTLGLRVPHFGEVCKWTRIGDCLKGEGFCCDEDEMIRTLLTLNEKYLCFVGKDRCKAGEEINDPVVEHFLIKMEKRHRWACWKLNSHMDVGVHTHEEGGFTKGGKKGGEASFKKDKKTINA
jgi:DNA-binding ferritin-like protein